MVFLIRRNLVDSGILKYTVLTPMVVEIIVLDSDNDLCSVFEAGFTDPDGDKLLGGTVTPTVDANGVVTSGIGYTIPIKLHYCSSIVFTPLPNFTATCELKQIFQ
jgi:hypothetical protein